jgi:hypothetical protein
MVFSPTKKKVFHLDFSAILNQTKKELKKNLIFGKLILKNCFKRHLGF